MSGPSGDRGDDELSELRRVLVTTIAESILQEAQLHEAIASRDVIGQAKGILMEREGVDAERAFEMLRSVSQHSNIRLKDVAAWIVDGTEERSKGLRRTS